jgi:hypothetical protein
MRPESSPSGVAPLGIAENGRHFVDRTGKPFFWLGDTLWHLYRSFSLDDVRSILRNRKDKGFSVVLVMLIGHEADPVLNINGDHPWVDSNPARPNESYFVHVDRALEIACELDFV